MYKNNHITELYWLRGLAVILMIVYHVVFDLTYYFNYNFDYLHGFWYYLGTFSAVTFMFLSGISNTLSSHIIKRSLLLISLSLTITMTTYLIAPTAYIQFGILHLLAVGSLLSIFTNKLSAPILIILGSSIILLGKFFAELSSSIYYLIPIGLTPTNYYSLDYYPLVPWYGFILFGQTAGKYFYKQKKRYFSRINPQSTLVKIGRHSLFIYLVHQPLLLGILYVLHKLSLL